MELSCLQKGEAYFYYSEFSKANRMKTWIPFGIYVIRAVCGLPTVNAFRLPWIRRIYMCHCVPIVLLLYGGHGGMRDNAKIADRAQQIDCPD